MPTQAGAGMPAGRAVVFLWTRTAALAGFCPKAAARGEGSGSGSTPWAPGFSRADHQLAGF